MQLNDVVSDAKAWVNPPHPGRGKSIVLAALLGLIAGPLGVGLVFRSLVDFALSALVTLALVLLGMDGQVAISLAGLAWAVGRVLHDNRTPPGAPADPRQAEPRVVVHPAH